jgi:hypothetical protein
MKLTALVRMSVSVPIIGTGCSFAWTLLSMSAPALVCMLLFPVVFGGTSWSTYHVSRGKKNDGAVGRTWS